MLMLPCHVLQVMDMQSQSVTKIPCIRGRTEKSLEEFVISPDGKYIAFLGNHGMSDVDAWR